jgi:hypothetical protein
MPRVYVETSVVSYLAARPSRNELIRVQQRLTRQWWRNDRKRYEIVASRLVVSEASAGNSAEAVKRLKLLDTLQILENTNAATAFAELLLQRGILPQKAAADALHLAIAVVNKVDFLLTWNCKHLANANIRKTIDKACQSASYPSVAICTPAELNEMKYD